MVHVSWADARSATLHCLTGCAIGEVLGMVLATIFTLGNLPTILVATALAFLFGYGLTMRALLQSGLALGAALTVALAADTVSILTMEVVDNATVALIPGALQATLVEPLFWASLALALGLAFLAAWPVNRWLMARGLGHARVHGAHGH